MPEHSPIRIPKFHKKMLQVCHSIRETVKGKGDIFVDAGASGGAHTTNGWDDALTRFPKCPLGDWIVCEFWIVQEPNFFDHLLRVFLEVKDRLCILALVLHENGGRSVRKVAQG